MKLSSNKTNKVTNNFNKQKGNKKMSLSNLAITETPAIDTWNQERSSDHLKGLLSRLSERAFANPDEELEFDF